MKIFNNQEVKNLRPEILLALRVADYVLTMHGEILQITWTTGGKHMTGSLHYKRRAFDAIPTRPENSFCYEEIRKLLGPDYDVKEEKECFHVEYDPK